MRADVEAMLRDYVAGTAGGLKAAAWRFAEEAEGAPGGAAPTPRAGAAEDAVLDRLDRDRGAMRLMHRAFTALSVAEQTVLVGYVTAPGVVRVAGLGALYHVALELPMVRAGDRLGEGRNDLLQALANEMGLEAVEHMASQLLEAAGDRLTHLVDLARRERGEALRRANRYIPRT